MIKIFFENPLYLWYLLSVPLLIISHFMFLKNAEYKAVRFSNFNTIKRLTGYGEGKVITKNWSILFIRLIILISVIFAITGPTLWYKGETHNQDFVIAIDTSASMLAKDFEPNRLEIAKEESKVFVDNIKRGSKIGLIDFAGSAFVDSVLTTDKNIILEKIDELNVVSIGGTDLSGAIISASNLLMNSDKGRVLIIVSDGSNTVDSYNKKAIDVSLEYARNNQIIINTVGIGSDSGPIGYLPEYYNVTALYDVEQLEYIANITEGNFYDGSNMSAFSNAFKDLLSNTDIAYIERDLSPILLLLGLLCLFLEWGMINTRYRRLP